MGINTREDLSQFANDVGLFFGPNGEEEGEWIVILTNSQIG
jgi:hypothetical protein